SETELPAWRARWPGSPACLSAPVTRLIMTRSSGGSPVSRRPDHVARALSEPVELSEYDPEWPALFAAEADALHAILPPESTGRIEHIGSTAVPGLAAKPIIDILIETPSLQRVQEEIAPILTARGYEFFWRPGPDALAWFIKRDEAGARTHHIHFMT